MNDASIIEVNTVLATVTSQRNQLADQVAMLTGKLAVANARISELEAQLKSLEATGEAPSS